VVDVGCCSVTTDVGLESADCIDVVCWVVVVVVG